MHYGKIIPFDFHCAEKTGEGRSPINSDQELFIFFIIFHCDHWMKKKLIISIALIWEYF